MPYIKVGEENSGSIDLYYEDHGSGPPVVLIHGWPASIASWEKQTAALLDAGYRVVAYDRRGFGSSARPASGYDYDTLAGDLNTLMTRLNLNDASLVGFSMGGGEVARYLSAYGSGRVCSATFVSAIPPCLLKGPDNPEAVDGSVFAGLQASFLADRPAMLSGFLSNFYNFDVLGGKQMSEDALRAAWNVAVSASARAAYECIGIWPTDFRADIPHIDVPTLIVHGDSDRIVPFEVSGKRLHEMVKGSQLHLIAGGPHGLIWTHGAEVNQVLLQFLKSSVRVLR